MTEEQLQTQVIDPTIHVVRGRGQEATTTDLRWSDVSLPGHSLDTISDPDLIRLVERWMDLPEGELADRKVNRPQTGNIIIGAPNVYG